jgi:hypothetical protein
MRRFGTRQLQVMREVGGDVIGRCSIPGLPKVGCIASVNGTLEYASFARAANTEYYAGQ